MFDELAEQGWSQSHDLVSVEWARSLALQCQNLYDQGRFAPAAVGFRQTKSVQTQIRGDSILWVEDAGVPSLQNDVNEFLQTLQDEMNQALYLGLKRFEAHFALYPPGRGYEKHIDNHTGLSHRRITFVFYLNENWQKSHGGALTLFDPLETHERIQTIEPRLGNFILFRSELFPHQVEESFETRKSLTGWFRDDAL